MRRRIILTVIAALSAFWSATGAAHGQSVAEYLDKLTFLRGVAELHLPHVLDAYIADHPAQDDVTQAQYDIARALLQYYEPDASTQQRTDAIERALSLRQELIDKHPGHPQRVIWQCEQATDLLFNLLPLDAAGTTVLIGLPNPQQRQRFARVAQQVNLLMEDAEVEITPTLRQLRELEDQTGNDAIRERRRTLAMNERDRRIPFLRGMGALLNATVNDEHTGYELAAELLLTVAPRLDGALAAKARIHAAMALLEINEIDQADALLQQALDDPATLPIDRLLAQLAAVDVVIAREGPDAGLKALDELMSTFAQDSKGDLFFAVLLADHRFLLLRQMAGETASQAERIERMQAAFDSYLALLRQDDDDDANKVLRSIVMNKLTLAVDDQSPLEALPPLVTIGRARQLAEANGFEEASELLRKLLDRSDLSETDHAAVLFALGRLAMQRGKPIEATEHYFLVARQFPNLPVAPQAIEHATRIMIEVHEQLPDQPSVRERLREVLAFALQSYSHNAAADHWRFAMGRLALQEQRFDDAIAAFEQTSAGSPLELDAKVMAVVTQRAAAQQTSDSAEAGRRNEDVIRRIGQLLPTLEQARQETADADRRAALAGHATMLRVMQAEALLALQEYAAALSVLETLPDPTTLDQETAAQVLRARLRVLQESGDIQRAHEAIAQFIDAAPKQAAQVVPPILASLEKSVKEIIDDGRPIVAQQKARNELLPIAEMMEEYLQEHAAAVDEAGALKARIADAYRYSEEYSRALPLYEALLEKHPNALQILFGKAECLYGLGETRYGDAFAIYKRIGSIGAEQGGEYYWQAQLRSLQILDALQRNTDDIYPHIQRLRQQDPQLGGERFRSAFQQLQNKYS